MTLIPIYTLEQIQAYIEAVELLNPELYENKDKILKELIEFRITTQEESQHNVTREKPYTGVCGCVGGPKGCNMCNCQLIIRSYTYRFHLYKHFFYPEISND